MSKPINFRPIFTALLLSGLPALAGAQVLYNNGAGITIASGGSLTVKGSLTNASAGTISNNGALNIAGNMVNNGTINAPAGSTLRLEGTAAQTLGGTSPINARDVIVNNAAGITLNTPLNVDGAMIFTAGILTATGSTAPVTFSANGSVGNTPTDASHINGYVAKLGIGTFIYPAGNATKYQPVGINLTVNGSGMTARYYATDPGSAPNGTGGSSATPLVAVNRKEYWNLVPAGSATGSVTIYFDSYNNTGINNVADLRVAHLSGGQWLNEGGAATGTIVSGSVTSNGISTFSPFTLGSVSTASPLPLTLTAFAGIAEGNRTRLDWKTTTEAPGTTFTTERSSTGGAFEALSQVTGKGGSADYTFYDEQPLSPVAYYRLRIAAGGGSLSYSPIVAVRRDGQGSGQIAVSPIPATDRITITSTNTLLNGTPVQVLDMQGREVSRFRLQVIQELDVHLWPAGSYMMRLADGTALRIAKH